MQVLLLTGQKLRLFSKILASSLLLIGSVLYAEPIGDVRESTGASQVTRQTGESYEGAVDLSVLFMDKMETMKGRMKVELIDESVFTITEHSMVIVDKFIYDPNPTKSTLALTFAKGTARFVTSKTGKIPKENISINTSSATIGIRGTDFTVTVDELGRTLVVLLPDETGAPSGSVIVSNLGGEIILDEGAVDLSVLFMDKMETMKGRMKVELIDESVFTITEHSMVIVDKFIYDPNPTKSTLALTFAKGTARFVTSKTGKIPKENISINTSSATIGIRGTDFTVTVDELGRTLVVLLPDETGAPSGSVIVSNLGGEIILDEAYQATLVQSYDVIPKETVILQGITIPMIDNMFIVNPPKEIRKIAEEEEQSNDDKDNILDIDYLEFDALEDNALDKEDAFEFTELDIDLLDVDFLQDVLDIVAELDKLTELDRKAEEVDSINIEGTTVGFDQDTQYNTLVDKSAGKITLNREVTGKIRITQPIYSNARIVTITDQKPSDIILGDGSGSNITIIQQ